MSESARPLLIAVPLYRAPHLLRDLFDALAIMASELTALGARLLFINDSPDDTELRRALADEISGIGLFVPTDVLENDANFGFVRSANRAFEIAWRTGADVILLNSDARPRPGAFAEMVAVAALDPMIGFVSPRSDNATICNSPYPDDWRAGGPDRAYTHHKAIEPHLPRYSYVPTAVGFCLYVKHLMLEEFGFFDEAYGDGYNEENDLIRRCNRRGYRAVLANRAYVHHLGEGSFALSPVPRSERERVNANILEERFPEYQLTIRRFYDGADFRAQRLLAGLIPLSGSRQRVLFDCRMLEPAHNGTSEHVRQLLQALAAVGSEAFELYVICDAEAYLFHSLDRIDGLQFCDELELRERPFAAAIRLVQPFLLEDVVKVATCAAVTGFLVLDTIAMDCQQGDRHGLDLIWRSMTETAALIGYNSAFTMAQFGRRIDVPEHVVQFVSRCSTDVRDYSDHLVEPSRGQDILVVGNDFPHKYVTETVDAIAALRPQTAVTTLGSAKAGQSAVSIPSGALSETEVDELYRACGTVVYPSHYEGFGFPILHGLARRRPVVARDLPPAREIKARAWGAANIHLGSTTAEIARLAASGPVWQEPEAQPSNDAENWHGAARALLEAVRLAIERFDFTRSRRQQAIAAQFQARNNADDRFHREEDASRRSADEARALSAELADARQQLQQSERSLAEAGAEAARQRERANRMSSHADKAFEETNAIRADARCRDEATASVARLDSQIIALSRVIDIEQPAIAASGEAAGGDILSRWSRWRRDRGAPHHRGVLTDPPPADCIGKLATLSLDWPRPRFGTTELELLLGWVQLLRIGGRLTLRTAGGHENGSGAAEAPLELLPTAAGCAPQRIELRWRRRLVESVKVRDWQAMLPGPDDDATFIWLAYRSILHREPDQSGADHYAALLRDGSSRAGILRSLLASPERLDSIAATLALPPAAQR